MSACPTLAYEKDPLTGIVKHLDDQCFGCQYCVLACPYEVPKFHAGKGIVRKCDMCSSRLKAGEAPACVQACPHEAIRISLVDIAEIRAASAIGAVLPTAPASRFTVPTTKYRSERVPTSSLRSGDEEEVTPEHNHVPLMVMLVLSQIAVGLILAATVADSVSRWWLLVVGSTIGMVASMAATAHLGRPWLAYRAVLGWRTSWLSREIIAFGAFQAVSSAAILVATWPGATDSMQRLVTGITAIVGLGGVFCSVMIYAVTPRTFWAMPYTSAKFFGTTFFTAALAWLVFGNGGAPAAFAASAIALFKLMMESRQRHVPGEDRWAERSARLLYGPLREVWILRCSLTMLGGVLGPMLLASVPQFTIGIACVTGLGCVMGEFVERSLFFRAAAAPRMPGGLAA